MWMDTRTPNVFLYPNTATKPNNPPQLCSNIKNNNQIANDQSVFTASTNIPTI